MLLDLLYRFKYPFNKLLIIASDEISKDQLIALITALTDENKILFDTKKKNEFSALLIDEVDVWCLDNAYLFQVVR